MSAPPRSSARAKVAAHGQQLLATATALGVAAACTKSDSTNAQTVTLPSGSSSSTTSATASATPSASATTLASASATAALSATASATATATATSVPTGPPTHGYAVVDPMPPPSRCAGSAASSKATGSYVKSGADTVLKITVKLGGGATWTGGAVNGYSGPVKSATANAAKDSIDIVLATKDYGASIPISCAAGKATLGVNVSPPATPPKVGDPATINVYDRY